MMVLLHRSRPVAVDTSPESEFARAIYQWLLAVPAGQVVSYGQLAQLAGFPRHSRFVGRLMARLPGASRLPWWRVVRSDGGLTQGDRQRDLLLAEGVALLGDKVAKRCFFSP